MTRVKVAIVNRSTVLDDQQVASISVACHKQALNDLRHYWLVEALVYFSPEGQAIAPDTWVIVVQDDLDVSGALGYHDLTDRDVPTSLIGARLDLEHGYAPSVTISHELCEMLVDPYINSGWQVGDRTWAATEVCDPCEADALGYHVSDHYGTPVLVSDFITPHWFQVGSPGPWDFCGHHLAPLTLLPGGYASIWTPEKGWQQVTGRSAPDALTSVADVTSDSPSSRARNSLRTWGRAAINRPNPTLGGA